MKSHTDPLAASAKLSAPHETAVSPASRSEESPERRRRTSASRTSDGNGHQVFDLRRLLNALAAARNGDFSVRLPPDWTGLEGKIADAFNDIMMANQTMAQELKRVSHAVGKEGKIRQRADFSSGGGAWRGMEDSVNTLIADLAWPITEVTRSIG